MSKPRSLPLAPLIERLLEECQRAGIAADSQLPGDSRHFTRWYRDTIVAMEAEVASHDGHPPMTPKDVELMCRSVLSASNLAEAIGIAADFCDMIAPRGGQLSLAVAGEWARFSMNSLRLETTPLTGLVDTVGLFAYQQLFSWLIGCPLKLQSVSLACTDREAVAPLLGLFNAPVLTAASVYALEFDAEQLLLGNVRSPAELGQFLEIFPCKIYGSRSATGIVEQVNSLMVGAIYQGQEIPSLKELAELLNLSQSTLRRRLQSEQSSYRKIREACLCRAAKELLSRGTWTIERLAEHLGFSDTSAFRRAFQRWTGQSPSASLRTPKS